LLGGKGFHVRHFNIIAFKEITLLFLILLLLGRRGFHVGHFNIIAFRGITFLLLIFLFFKRRGFHVKHLSILVFLLKRGRLSPPFAFFLFFKRR